MHNVIICFHFYLILVILVSDISTNIGIIPKEDYLDIVAMQYGFDSYEDLRLHGLFIDLSEDDK